MEAAKRGLAPKLKADLIDEFHSAAGSLRASSDSLNELRRLWGTSIPDFRVFCLTEDPTSASMWNHYAESMSGAVLEFVCREERDSPWFEARPVTYSTPVAEMFNADEPAEIVMLAQPQAQEAILDRATFRKSPEWSYEKEWRVVSSRRAADTEHYTDYPFHTDELAAVYLGPKIAPADRDALVTSARPFPRARVILMEIEIGRGFRQTVLSD